MEFNPLKKYIRKLASTATKEPVIRFLKWLDAATTEYRNIQAFGLWVAAGAVGFSAVLYATLFRYVDGNFKSYFEDNPMLAVGLTPIFFFLAWWVVYRFAPEASGSGIPQIMAAIEIDYTGPGAVFVNRLLGLKTAAIKVVSSLLCLAGGGAIGREGPTLQISGAIFHYFGRVIRRFYPNTDEQTWVIAGAAAGLASAFNTPLGGIVYAIEELGMKHFHRIRTALLTAVIISGIVAQSFLGSYLYLGFPKTQNVTGGQWPLIIFTALMGGALGAAFSKSLIWGARFRRKLKSPTKLGLVAVGSGVIAGALIYFIPTSSGSGIDTVSKILFENESASFLVVIGRFFGTAVAYLSGAAGGIFSPSLTIGAVIGSKLAYLFSFTNANLLTLVGMVAFLTGVTHTPFTSFILVMEMSDRHSAIFPMMVAGVIAMSISKSIYKKSFYETIRDDLLELHTPSKPDKTSDPLS